MEIKELEAKGGVPLKVKIRPADHDRLAHMKEYFMYYQGMSPSDDVLIRWMIEFCMEALDNQNSYYPKYVRMGISESYLTDVVEDDPLVLPDIIFDVNGCLIPYGYRRLAVEKIVEEYGDSICNDCWESLIDEFLSGIGIVDVSCWDTVDHDCPSTKGKE